MFGQLWGVIAPSGEQLGPQHISFHRGHIISERRFLRVRTMRSQCSVNIGYFLHYIAGHSDGMGCMGLGSIKGILEKSLSVRRGDQNSPSVRMQESWERARESQ